jgi:hypothetical protein
LRNFSAALQILLLSSLSAAGTIEHRADFDVSDLVTVNRAGTSLIQLGDCRLRGEPGAPLLPARSFAFVLPAGAEHVEVIAIPSSPVRVEGRWLIEPAPVLGPLGSSSPGYIRSWSEHIYGSPEDWPRDVLIESRTGRLCGFTVVSGLLQPFRYSPLSGDLHLYGTVDIEISWEEGIPEPVTGAQFDAAAWRLSRLVLNPDDLASYSPPVRDGTTQDVEHLILCDSQYVNLLQPLAEYHTGEGRSSAVITVQDILRTYTGADDPERVRNCLREHRLQSGTVSVLLVGDDTLMPARFIHTECEGYYDLAPSDLYYADLDGTWDGNGDGVYGQPDDDLDLYADLLVGRAPVSTAADIGTFVDKTLLYMTAPPPGPWSTEAVLCGAILFEEQGYTAAKGCDLMADQLPASWEIIKAYEVLHGSYIDTHVQYITDGSGWTHYAGHGNTRGVYWHDQGKGMMTTWMADTLWNGDMTGVHSSIGCHPGAYQDEEECLAEVLLNRPDRGAVAVLFNTSYGWEGFWPEIGSSERMCVNVVREVFPREAPSLGLAFAAAKDQEIPWAHGGYDRVLQSLLSWTAFHDPPLRVLGVPAIEPVPPQPMYMTAPWPNPATRDAPVAFEVLFEESPVQVSVHDLCGRLVWKGETETGIRTTWDGCDSGGNRVPAGVYVITARMNTAITSRKVTVLD